MYFCTAVVCCDVRNIDSRGHSLATTAQIGSHVQRENQFGTVRAKKIRTVATGARGHWRILQGAGAVGMRFLWSFFPFR